MDSDGHKGDQSEPQLCIKGCGFFGSSSTENMCSKCYKEHLIKLEAESIADVREKNVIAPMTASINGDDQTPKIQPASDEGDAENSKSATDEGDVGDTKPARCFSCRKRVGLTGIKCRCGNTYCGLHRYPEEHGCSFDYKTHGREALAKANPLIKADKLHKI